MICDPWGRVLCQVRVRVRVRVNDLRPLGACHLPGALRGGVGDGRLGVGRILCGLRVAD